MITTNERILIDFRKKYDLTQRYIAYKMGVTQQAVVKWEKGRSNPRAEQLPKLARLLDCSIDQLLDERGDEYENKLNDQQRAI